LQADALETLVQVFTSQKKFLRMHLFEKENPEVKLLKRHYNILKVLLLLRGSDSSIEYCYRPNQFTQRLLKKLKLISEAQVKATSNQEQLLAKKFNIEQEPLLVVPQFIPHNFEQTMKVNNSLFKAEFKLLKDTKAQRASTPYTLPGPKMFTKEDNELHLFPMAKKEQIQDNKQSTDKPIVWNLINEKMELEFQLQKNITKELFNLHLWDDVNSSIESPHLLITSSTVANWKQEYIKNIRTVLYGKLLVLL